MGRSCAAPGCPGGPHAPGLSPPQNFLYKCIGTTLAICSNKDLVRKQLQELLETARYQEEAEREVGSAGLAWPGRAPPKG